MPIITKRVYEPSMCTIESEEDISRLIKDVMTSIEEVDSLNFLKSKIATLKLVESGGYRLHERIAELNIDLSKAKELVEYYRANSEGGCKSCRYGISFHTAPDEHHAYCSLNETEEDILSTDKQFSTYIQMHSDKGCKDIKRKFTRTIEEILCE